MLDPIMQKRLIISRIKLKLSLFLERNVHYYVNFFLSHRQARVHQLSALYISTFYFCQVAELYFPLCKSLLN